jgi:hypothetical protein
MQCMIWNFFYYNWHYWDTLTKFEWSP